MKIITAFVLMLAVTFGMTVSAHAGGAVVIAPHAPPAPKVIVRPAAPSRHHLWIAGHWGWKGGQWVWVKGHHAKRPYTNARWIPGHWKKRPRGWVWVPGHWSRA